MPTRQENMTRLHRRLVSIDHIFYGTHEGVGQVAIFKRDLTYIPDSEYWIVDYLEGPLKASHIFKPLVQGCTPYDIIEATNKRRRK